MCVAHGKDLSDWLRNDETFELVTVLAQRLGIQPNSAKMPNSIKTRVSATYPTLVIVKRGSRTESEVIKAVVCDIPLGESVLDAYMLPSGEKRIGSSGVGLALSAQLVDVIYSQKGL
jgi:hypothetical protein